MAPLFAGLSLIIYYAFAGPTFVTTVGSPEKAKLATELGAERCALVKSSLGTPAGTPATWAKSGLVDPAFPRFAAAFGGEIASP